MPEWKITEYQGWKNCYSFENQWIKLIVTADVGPRVIFFGAPDGVNQFFENEAEVGTIGNAEWLSYGGHRFWTAPEDKERTYVADNFPVKIEIQGTKLLATAPVETCGVQKTLVLEINDLENTVKVDHILSNRGPQAMELAPWGLSVMRAGGTAIIPMPAKSPHPARLTPTHSFTHWGYTDITDPRYGWGDHFLFLRQDENMENPQKIGVHNCQDWAAYLNNGSLFIKYVKFQPNLTYPDFGSHFEFFTNNLMLEVESLGGLTVLQPGQQVEHIEFWSLFDNIKTVISEDEIQRNILPLVERNLKVLQLK